MIVQGISLLCTKKESIGYEIFVYLKFPFGMLDKEEEEEEEEEQDQFKLDVI